jgi:hypothetical protein
MFTNAYLAFKFWHGEDVNRVSSKKLMRAMGSVPVVSRHLSKLGIVKLMAIYFSRPLGYS